MSDENKIYKEIVKSLESGDPLFYKETRFPSIRTLSKQYKISPTVISKVVSKLLKENMVHSKKGIGLYCGPRKCDRFRFIQDNDGHWYCIKVADTHPFHQWVDAMEDADFETLDNLPDFNKNRCMGPTHFSFETDPTAFTINKSDWEPEEYR